MIRITTLVCLFAFFYNLAKIPTLYYATSNPVKFKEAQDFFQQAGIALSLKQYSENIPEIQSLNQKEIALQKAKKAWKRLKVPVIVDDAGTYFEKYDNFPGTLTKFVYEALGAEGICKLFEPGERAYFQLHLVFYYGLDKYHIFCARTHGTLTWPAYFEYTPKSAFHSLFIPDGSTKTCTQLIAEGAYAPFNFRVKVFKQFAENLILNFFTLFRHK